MPKKTTLPSFNLAANLDALDPKIKYQTRPKDLARIWDYLQRKQTLEVTIHPETNTLRTVKNRFAAGELSEKGQALFDRICKSTFDEQYVSVSTQSILKLVKAGQDGREPGCRM